MITTELSRQPQDVEPAVEPAGLFELELPTMGSLKPKPADMSLEKAVQLCQLYREWFKIDDVSLSSRERVYEEFVL